MGGGKAIAQPDSDAAAGRDEGMADQERGKSRFGRVYKRRECDSCGSCDHQHHQHHGAVDALGEKLSATLTLAAVAAPRAPAPALATAAAAERPAVEPAAVEAPVEKEKPAAKTKRSARSKLAQGKDDLTVGRSPLASKAGKNNSIVVNKAEQKSTDAPKKAQGKAVKQVEDGKENRARGATRKQRSLKEIDSLQS